MKKVILFLTVVLIVAFSSSNARAFRSHDRPLQSSTVKSISFYLWAAGLENRGQDQSTPPASSQEEKTAQFPEELEIPLKHFFGLSQN